MPPTFKALGLYDLLAPQFLAGFQFPDYIDKYLSLLAVADLQTASDAGGVVYTGIVYFPSGQTPVLTHKDPSGAVFDFHEISMGFRLLIPRAGSAPVKDVVDTLAGVPGGLINFSTTKKIFDTFGNATAAPSDYPGIGFQLELLLSALSFHLGKDWVPGKRENFKVVPDTLATDKDVRVVLPKVLLRYTQGQDFKQAPSFKLASWGNAGFNAPNDLSEGELATMDPPIAISTSGKWAFSIDTLIFDDSDDSTPPELLGHFGVDESFTGVYAKALQLFYTDSDKDFALNVAIQDALVSFKGEVWLEAEVDVMFADGPFKATLTAYDGAKPLPLNPGQPGASPSTTWTGGSLTMPGTGVIFVQVQGGVPPFHITAEFTASSGGGSQSLWKEDPGQGIYQAQFDPPPAADVNGSLVVQVTDASATPQTYKNTLSLMVTAAGASPSLPAGQAATTPAAWVVDSTAPPPAGDGVQFTPASSGTTETLTVLGGSDASLPAVKLDGKIYGLGIDRQVVVQVDPGQTVQVEVDYPDSSAPGTFNLLFQFNEPANQTLESQYYNPAGPPDPTPSQDTVFPTNTVPAGVPGGAGHTGADSLRYWAANALDLTKPITIAASASNEGHVDKDGYDTDLSQRRAEVAAGILNGIPGAPTPIIAATGHVGKPASSRQEDRVAIVTGSALANSPAYTLLGHLSRENNAPATSAAPKKPPLPPGPPANQKPRTLRRLSLRIRLEKNVPVMVELSGELDFETEMESSLRNAPGSDPGGSLALKPTKAATSKPNPSDGIVDFTLNVTFDLATRDLTETLTLGAAPADIDGLLRMENPEPYGRLKNILGSVLIFTPILSSATEALAPGSAGDWAAIGVDLGVAAGIGALGFVNTTDVTLYGGTLQFRQNVPADSNPVKFTNASLLFDYGVNFRIDINALDIHSTRPLAVRYKAVGVNLNFDAEVGGPKFQFVLDTSKGYSLDLSDPGLFHLPGALGDLLKIAAARIAQFNPLTLELDIEIKADLGVITVDKFKVKVPLDPPGAPMILPSGIKVNIPAALVGSGSVKIEAGGFQGSIDLTLCPVKLRVAADVGVQHISQPPREATAFFLGLEVDFPAPIVLGATGLGLFGLFGLFAMNYDRILPQVPAGDAVGPDLKWLMNTGGKPQGIQFWEPKLDNWAFGLGVVLGTVDGFLLNMRGMFLLELPGPRIIITVNLKFIADLPGITPGKDGGIDPVGLDVGIVGILDIDIGAGQITLGVMINLEIKDLIQIKIPVQLFFDWNQTQNWHFWLGTFSTPCSANILGIVKGSGYFMIGGEAISPFPPNATGTPLPSLPGTAVAMGVAASIIWGSESAGMYLKVAASADFGVSFNPHLFVVGQVHLEGELRLLIVSIGAYGDFLLKAPDPVFLNVHVCGKVSFFFFDISACVDFTIGNDVDPAPAPALISRMYLQSYAPVIAQGQGDKPIDASLGNAIETVASGTAGGLTLPASQGDMPVVPIDSVPVVQMIFGTDALHVTQTFTEPLKQCVTWPGATGVNLGGGRFAHYALKNLLLDPPLPPGVAAAPAAWRPNKPAGDQSQTQVDLALFSRNPSTTTSAAERSSELTETMTSIWADACRKPAPPTQVFWAFCGQRLGPSTTGWTLYGIALPDPPDTVRTSPPPSKLIVEQPAASKQDALLLAMGLPLTGMSITPAQVIGIGHVSLLSSAVGRLICERALELPELLQQSMKTDIGAAFNNRGVDAVRKIKDTVANNRWIRLHTGLSRHVSLLLGIHSTFFKRAAGQPALKQVVIRERDAAGNLLAENNIFAMNPKVVSLSAGLPADWIGNTSPWFPDVQSILIFFSSVHLTPVFFDWKPTEKTAIVEVAVVAAASPIPSVAIGAIATLPQSEVDRFETTVQIQQSTVQQVQAYLDGGTPVPLLAKDTTYTVTVNYDVTTTEPDGTTNQYNGNTQAFQFRTDNKPPASLSPYVLYSWPNQGDTFVFYEDAAAVFFNDGSTIQMFAAYGYQLEIDLRAADGLPDVKGAPVTTTAINGVGTASYDTLLGLVKSGVLGCAGATVSPPQNHVTPVPAKLRPLMGYTLDINTNPATPVVSADAAVVPLFRRSFSTGRYANLQAFAGDLHGTLITHRALHGPLGFSPTGGAVLSKTDQEIQDALTAAGEQALPAAQDNRVVMYWVPAGPNGPYVPHAILIDSVEPVWRVRPEAEFEFPIPSDPAFKIVTVQSKVALEVREKSGGSSIGGYVRSPGGARTIVFLAPGFAPPQNGTPVTLVLHRPSGPYPAVPEATADLLSVIVAPQAPWENDHV